MEKGSVVTIAGYPEGKTGLLIKTNAKLAINESDSFPFNQIEVCEILWSDGKIGWLPSSKLEVVTP